ncbi:MAG: hypothetical protein QNK11_03645 [Legionella sp.]|nr:hypothetical protein [Legionella sp.]
MPTEQTFIQPTALDSGLVTNIYLALQGHGPDAKYRLSDLTKDLPSKIREKLIGKGQVWTVDDVNTIYRKVWVAIPEAERNKEAFRYCREERDICKENLGTCGETYDYLLESYNALLRFKTDSCPSVTTEGSSVGTESGDAIIQSSIDVDSAGSNYQFIILSAILVMTLLAGVYYARKPQADKGEPSKFDIEEGDTDEDDDTDEEDTNIAGKLELANTIIRQLEERLAKSAQEKGVVEDREKALQKKLAEAVLEIKTYGKKLLETEKLQEEIRAVKEEIREIRLVAQKATDRVLALELELKDTELEIEQLTAEVEIARDAETRAKLAETAATKRVNDLGENLAQALERIKTEADAAAKAREETKRVKAEAQRNAQQSAQKIKMLEAKLAKATAPPSKSEVLGLGLSVSVLVAAALTAPLLMLPGVSLVLAILIAAGVGVAAGVTASVCFFNSKSKQFNEFERERDLEAGF